MAKPHADHNLYQLLGLECFSTSIEIENAISRFQACRQIRDIKTAGAEFELALAVLRKPISKEAYDILLAALKRSDRKFPKILAPELRAEIVRVAGILELDFEPGQTNQLRRDSATANNTSSNNEKFTFVVGKRQMNAIACSFQRVSGVGSGVNLIKYAFPCGRSCNIPSQAHTFIIQKTIEGDSGIVVFIGFGLDEPSVAVAFASLRTGNFGAIPFADQVVFGQSLTAIANLFEIRNTPRRIKQVRLKFYRALANVLTKLVPTIEPTLAAKWFLEFAQNQTSMRGQYRD